MKITEPENVLEVFSKKRIQKKMSRKQFMDRYQIPAFVSWEAGISLPNFRQLPAILERVGFEMYIFDKKNIRQELEELLKDLKVEK